MPLLRVEIRLAREGGHQGGAQGVRRPGGVRGNGGQVITTGGERKRQWRGMVVGNFTQTSSAVLGAKSATMKDGSGATEKRSKEATGPGITANMQNVPQQNLQD